MSPAGLPESFVGLARKRTVRAAINPMDKSTVVSIYPRSIDEVKPTITPSRYKLEAGSYENPSVLVVTSASWWREIDEESPLLEITNSSIQVADSIVRDYCNGILACNMGDAMPGLFYIMGEFSSFKVRESHKALLDRANERQNRWYKALVNMADTLWAKSNGNPLVISDDMRLGAKALNLNNKDWMQDFTMMETVRCVACGSPRNPAYPVCPTCHAVVDEKKAAELGIKFAT